MARAGDPAALLRIRGLGKSYAAPVLVDVELDLVGGEVHALVGANGAGKSTLARLICGIDQADTGEMELEGAAYAPRGKREAERLGVHLIPQELNLIATLSVAENLFLPRLPSRFGMLDRPRLEAAARAALATVGLDGLDPWTVVGGLGVGHQQLVEIAKALAHPCRMLILDEPTAALTSPEIETLFGEIDRLRRAGVALVYVSHRMEEIQRIADRTTVLRDGRVVHTGPTAELPTARALQLMVGREVARAMSRERAAPGAVALTVEGLSRGELVDNVSFTVRRGEILGVAGLVGSGRTELLRAVFGADAPDAGRVLVGDPPRRVKIEQPSDAVRAGIGMVPEDRKEQGLLLQEPVRVNATLARLSAMTHRGGWLDLEAERGVAEQSRDAMAVRCSSVEQPVRELSGGNQQKVLIGRWLLRDVDVLLFDEPTRGIDVEAKEMVYRVLGELAAAGKALVVVSSELEELLAICDRIAVMSAGKMAATLERDECTHERIMTAAFSNYLSGPDAVLHGASA
ncbi:MAG: sugar ABC transporter ATP-binding protein [Gemmatimonadetes bacterium]|nr:sugar ABC transporter ATP-binding protein [Gemmatimonadota bacterium]